MCLGLLAFGDASGYEIKKEFEQGPLRHFMDASFGSIYPALTRMTEDGLLECRMESQDKRPDKKVYSITAKGTEALEAALAGPIGIDKVKSDFSFVMLFADRLPRSRVKALIDEQITFVKDSVAELEETEVGSDNAGASFVRRYGIAINKAQADFLERNRHFIEAAARDDGQPAPRHVEPVS